MNSPFRELIWAERLRSAGWVVVWEPWLPPLRADL